MTNTDNSIEDKELVHKWQTSPKQPSPWTCSCGFVAENGNEAANHALVNML